MSNIPRRRIYEVMLQFEDSVLEMQILIYSQKNFNQFNSKFEPAYNNLNKTYFEILGLFFMFLENRKYPLNTDMDDDLKIILKNLDETHLKISKTKAINKRFPLICTELEKKFEEYPKINTLKIAKIVYESLDKFNHMIPDLLTISRDELDK